MSLKDNELPLETGSLTSLDAFGSPPCHMKVNFVLQISEAGKNVSKKCA